MWCLRKNWLTSRSSRCPLCRARGRSPPSRGRAPGPPGWPQGGNFQSPRHCPPGWQWRVQSEGEDREFLLIIKLVCFFKWEMKGDFSPGYWKNIVGERPYHFLSNNWGKMWLNHASIDISPSLYLESLCRLLLLLLSVAFIHSLTIDIDMLNA